MKWRFSSLVAKRGAGAVRALLVIDLMVGLAGLAIGTTADFPARASQNVLSVAVPATPDGVLPDAGQAGAVPRLTKTHLSATEFALALRAGEVKFGTWNPDSKVFVVDLNGVPAARP